MSVRETGHWRGVTVMAFAAAGTGLLFTKPALLLASVVAVAFAAHARSGTPPAVALDVERTIADPTPEPGEAVAVETTVRNEGRTVVDLRV